MPERVQLSRRKGWRKPENTAVVARPSRYGNPFRVEGGSVIGLPWFELRADPIGTRYPKRDEFAVYTTHSDRAAAVDHAVDLFRAYARVTLRDSPMEFERWIAPLRGRNLACWCPLDQPCHADVLLEIANGEAP